MASQNQADQSSRTGRLGSSLNTSSGEASLARPANIFVLPRQKSRSRERRDSRMYLVDGQLCWGTTDDPSAAPIGSLGSKRNSSVGLLFGSSMDLSGFGQSMDSSQGAASDEAISYRIKWCRENIMQLKRQTWPMEKKLQVLKASKMFIKQHQGELKQSKQAKDVIVSTSAILDRYWRHFKREFANLLVIITPWEMRIKKIESHFGSVVASYFTFLRWIFWLNLANSLVMVSFVMVPELIENAPDSTGMRKGELGMQRKLDPVTGTPMDPPPEFNPTLSEMWEFEGFLKFSPIFYGYYSNIELSKTGFWRNPLAFLLSAMLTYLFCFFCISRKLSQNTKLSRIGSKDDEYTFCWTVFVGWDFMIGNSETAYNKTSSLVMNLKEGILEEKEQIKDRDWRLIIRRVMANVLTLMLIVASAYVVTLAVQRSENLPDDASLLQKNELQLVMSGIQFMFPPLFDVIGIIEKYHPRKALSWQLGRILFLDFLNFYTLMFSLFGTVDQMGVQLNEVSGNITLLRKNTTYYENLFTTTGTTITTNLTPTTTTTTSTQSSTAIAMDSPTSNSSLFNSTTMFSNGANLPNLALSSTQQPGLSVGGINTTSSSSNISTSMPSGGLSESLYGLQASGFTQAPSDQNNLTASGILTSVLLASSTMMPSTSERPSHVTSVTMSVLEPTSGLPNLSTQMSPTTSMSSDLATGATQSTLPYTESATVVTFAVTEFTTSQSDSKSSTPTGDEDYPDIGDVIKEVASPKRKRRSSSKHLLEIEGEFEPDEGPEINQVEREDSATSGAHSTLADLVAANSGKVYLPTIQDPYKKLGRTQWPPMITSRVNDEDQEEPLEGRLLLGSSRKNRPTSTQAPRARLPGVARPIGQPGKSRGDRVQLASVTSTRSPYTDLNDDANEDVLDPSILSTTARIDSISRQNKQKTEDLNQNSLDDYNNKSEGKNTGKNQDLEGSSSSSLVTGLPPEKLDSPSRDLPLSETQSIPSEGSGMGSLSAQSGIVSIKNSNGAHERPIDDVFLENPPSRSSSQGCETTTTFAEIINGNLSYSNLKTSIGFNASEVSYADCIEIPEFKPQEILALNDTLKDKLKTLCWETMFGQEMVKIVVMDLVMTVVSAVSFEFMRACFVRYCNRFFFWDLERGFPGYQDFKIAENVLHLVNNQSTVWMGMFFAPGLPAINTVKLAVLMYVRSWAVLTCNIPHETVFKVSKSNNFYYWILLINLLICILPVAYAVTWIRPSWHCGPFGGECRMYLVVTKLVKQLLPPEANSVFKYLTSPGAVIPILISLILIIYYLASTVSSSKEANKELKAQLKKDKEQEAAVPEITNTTVDTTPAPGVAVPPPVVPSSGLGLPSSSLQQPTGNSMSTVAGQAQRMASAALGVQQGASTLETKPKSLLMPPSI